MIKKMMRILTEEVYNRVVITRDDDQFYITLYEELGDGTIKKSRYMLILNTNIRLIEVLEDLDTQEALIQDVEYDSIEDVCFILRDVDALR